MGIEAEQQRAWMSQTLDSPPFALSVTQKEEFEKSLRSKLRPL